jgi:hypothetical protein
MTIMGTMKLSRRRTDLDPLLDAYSVGGICLNSGLVGRMTQTLFHKKS